jgi:hypothetical protein
MHFTVRLPVFFQADEDAANASVHRQQHSVVGAAILVIDVRKLFSICIECVHR